MPSRYLKTQPCESTGHSGAIGKDTPKSDKLAPQWVRKYFAVLEPRGHYHGNELPIIFSYEGLIDAEFFVFDQKNFPPSV